MVPLLTRDCAILDFSPDGKSQLRDHLMFETFYIPFVVEPGNLVTAWLYNMIRNSGKR